MVNRCGPSLEFLADAAQLADELGGMTDGLVRIRDLLKSRYQLLCKISASVSAETAVLIRIIFKYVL